MACGENGGMIVGEWGECSWDEGLRCGGGDRLAWGSRGEYVLEDVGAAVWDARVRCTGMIMVRAEEVRGEGC